MLLQLNTFSANPSQNQSFMPSSSSSSLHPLGLVQALEAGRHRAARPENGMRGPKASTITGGQQPARSGGIVFSWTSNEMMAGKCNLEVTLNESH